MAKLHCRVLKGPYHIPGSGVRGDGKPRHFMQLEVMDSDLPEPGLFDYSDDVEVVLVSTKNRKKSPSKKRR